MKIIDPYDINESVFRLFIRRKIIIGCILEK